MKKRSAKKVIAILLICAVALGGAGVGGYHYLQNRASTAVNVYPVSEASSTNSWFSTIQTDGLVTTDRMQSVYLTSTMTVTDIFVEEGQEVKAGDPILAFDTTLDEVKLERKRIEIEQTKLDLEEAEARLKEIGTYGIGTPSFPEPKPTEEPVLNTVAVPYFQGGSGTQGDPYVYLWGEDMSLYDAMVDYLIGVARGEAVPYPAEPAAPSPTPGEPTPTPEPTQEPETEPTAEPVEPTEAPTTPPETTDEPEPTETPVEPTETPVPTDTPAPTDTPVPTEEPTPTPEPTAEPTPVPTEDPSAGQGDGLSAQSLPVRPSVMLARRTVEDILRSIPSHLNLGTVYIVFELRDANALNGDLLSVFEIAFRPVQVGWNEADEPVGTWIFQVMQPDYVPLQQSEGYVFDMPYFDFGIYYPLEEINRMKAEALQQISDLQLQLKLQEQELKQIEFELSNGEVVSDIAGVVKTLRTPEEALMENAPVALISGGGGYIIEAVMGEFDLATLSVGDTVTVNDWMSGAEVEGTITELSEYPVDISRSYYWYSNQSGNNNVSYYPFTVSVSEDASLRENYSVTVYLNGSPYGENEEANFYLENEFIRTESGRSYVYVAGENDLLEKRYVTAGKSMNGWATEIVSGLDLEEFVAFPYGRAVKEGAKVVYQEDLQALWNTY